MEKDKNVTKLYYPFGEDLNVAINKNVFYIVFQENQEFKIDKTLFHESYIKIDFSFTSGIMFVLADFSDIGMFTIPVDFNFYDKKTLQDMVVPKILYFSVIDQEGNELDSRAKELPEKDGTTIYNLIQRQLNNPEYDDMNSYMKTAKELVDALSASDLIKETKVPESFLFMPDSSKEGKAQDIH